MTPDVISPEQFRVGLGHFASGIVVVTARRPQGVVGMTCQSFFSVSLDPPLVALSPGRTSTTWPAVAAVGEFCVSILSHEQAELGRRFAISGSDKFAGVEWSSSPLLQAPVLDGCLAFLECRMEQVHDAGDHYLVIARVLDLAINGGAPLLFYRGTFGTFNT
jgi:3-hydroxy-9,10-secoandrosta-1,3,5(10)-triene-9,17-dione monooxygenase reductase component